MSQLTLPRVHLPHADERVATITSDLRRDDVGIFADDGDWIGPPHARRQPVGYVGVLEDTYEGWAVFSCTRDVAEAIVAAHQREVDGERERFRRKGVCDEDLDIAVAATTTTMSFDGEDIVVDERGFHADLHAFRRIKPEYGGRYVINGYLWPWVAINARECDQIVGGWPLTP